MTNRRRAGRARYTTSQRATAREIPPPETEEYEMAIDHTWTADEIAERCRRLGHVVEELARGGFHVKPSDGKPIVKLPGQFRSRADRSDHIGHLRRVGIDVLDERADERATEKPEMTKRMDPAQFEKLHINGARPTLTYEKPEAPSLPKAEPAGDADAPVDPWEYIELLEGRLDRQSRIMQHLESEQEELRTRIERLENMNGGVGPKPPSNSEILRGRVLEFMQGMPNMKLTVQMIALNIEVPEELGKTAAAGACGELKEAGRIQGGSTKGGGEGSATMRGVYWYDPEQDALRPQDK